MGADQGLTRVFYDGDCSQCCGAVGFLARRNASRRIRFAPLTGTTFQRLVPPEVREGLPDSLVVLTVEGQCLVRSRALIHLLQELGPGWRFLGACLAWVPRFFLDGAYRLVAGLRKPKSKCSIPTFESEDRFEP